MRSFWFSASCDRHLKIWQLCTTLVCCHHRGLAHWASRWVEPSGSELFTSPLKLWHHVIMLNFRNGNWIIFRLLSSHHSSFHIIPLVSLSCIVSLLPDDIRLLMNIKTNNSTSILSSWGPESLPIIPSKTTDHCNVNAMTTMRPWWPDNHDHDHDTRPPQWTTLMQSQPCWTVTNNDGWRPTNVKCIPCRLQCAAHTQQEDRLPQHEYNAMTMARLKHNNHDARPSRGMTLMGSWPQWAMTNNDRRPANFAKTTDHHNMNTTTTMARPDHNDHNVSTTMMPDHHEGWPWCEANHYGQWPTTTNNQRD